MLLLLLQYLKRYELLSPDTIALLTSTATRIALAAISTLFITLALGRPLLLQLYRWKIGQPIRTNECPILGELHRNKQDTPTMGGGLIAGALILSLFLWMDLSHLFTWVLFAASLFFCAVGAYDDYLKLRYKSSAGLKKKWKYLLEFSFALLVMLSMHTPLLKELIHLPIARLNGITYSWDQAALLTNIPFYLPSFFSSWGILGTIVMILFGIFVITGSTNAVNLTDGLDGLAASTTLLAAIPLAVCAFLSNNFEIASFLSILYIEGSGEVAVYLAALIGSCLGFLWFNCYPAQVFMGDTGSLMLGGILGTAAVLLRRELLLGICGGIFVLETLSVIIQVAYFRWSGGKRVFLCAPIHHHFEYKGWHEVKVVARILIIQLFLLICALLSLRNFL
jgi:phospho-N-acetylmuramoyl-pentapeptide-transferase